MRRLLAIVVFAATLPSTTAAQQSTDGPYVLHEYVEEIDLSGPDAEPREEGAPRPEGEALFGAGQPPALSLETRPGEPIYDKDGPVFDRPIDTPYGPLAPYAAANTLDDRTDRVDSLTYFANFDPSIIPYKRVVAKNHAVRRGTGGYALDVFTAQRRAATMQEMPEEPADVFWGTFLVRLERGRLHPIASISPDQRILQVVTEPDIALDIERDGADNFFVRSDQEGLVRINLQIAVPSFYFGGPFPSVSWADFPTHVTPPLTDGLRAHGLMVAQRIGFNKTTPPSETIVEMVRYFRNFDARPFPDSLKGGDLLEAIATSAIGVCRHRSLAFVFLAQAMGIPTRYVYNEAHAFVEVFWPGRGWRRIDLGGAADELNASANDGRPVHDPGNDGLPTPQRFLDEQQRMAHNGWEPPANAPGQRPQSSGASSTTAQSDGGANGAESAGDPEDGVDVELTQDAPPSEPPPPDERREARLRIIDATPVVRRGQALQLEAVLVDTQGKGLGGREVEIFLGAVGSTNVRAARQIGTTRTGPDGRLRTQVDIPREHAIGRWSLFLSFRGDTEFKPAVAE